MRHLCPPSTADLEIPSRSISRKAPSPSPIGYGKILFEKDMTEYEKFHLDIKYRSDRTPTLLTIVTSSSYLGDYFTGGSGSVAYFDEFRFIYY
ncbi:MAG: PCMD domain-containing protein [Bacteroidales bacterium]|nr:PCMD domain-containing protein [Bacteroidales bacterium]